jgi:quercetin 2,3-dioxygenase
MITVRRATQRYHEHRRTHDVWHTFGRGTEPSPTRGDFGALDDLDDGRIGPGAAVTHRRDHDAQIITYVHEGSVAYEGPGGSTVAIQAGEFQQRTIARGARHRDRNPSRVDAAHIVQVWLRCEHAAGKSKHEQKRFSTAERRGVLCVVASPDRRQGSLHTDQDALLHSAVLDPGQHVVHELAEGRSAWLHLVRGEATLGDVVLCTGDGAGITADRAVSITAREVTEILLLNLAQTPDAA